MLPAFLDISYFKAIFLLENMLKICTINKNEQNY